MTKENTIIILGTAHLSTTPGKCSPDRSLIEAVYSREIVEDIEATLKGYGWTVLVDYKPLEPNFAMKGKTVKDSQNKELSYRVNFVNTQVNKNPGKVCIYVSVHVNGAGNGSQWMKARGWSAYTTSGLTCSDKLATDLYWAAERNLGEYVKTFDSSDGIQKPIRRDTSDGDPDIESNLYVLSKTKCAAVLTENMFQDNRKDVEFLLSDYGRHEIVRLHVGGIMKYLGEL